MLLDKNETGGSGQQTDWSSIRHGADGLRGSSAITLVLLCANNMENVKWAPESFSLLCSGKEDGPENSKGDEKQIEV